MKGNLISSNSLLIIIDIQEKFRQVIFEFDRVVENTSKKLGNLEKAIE